MPPAAFEPAIPASERLQTHVLDRAVTGNGALLVGTRNFSAAYLPLDRTDPFQSNCQLHDLSI